MNTLRHVFSTALLLSFIFSISLTAFAQESSSDAAELTEGFDSESIEQTGDLQCFDYYTLGSVRTSFSASASEALPGETIEFNGSLQNENQYPMVDGQLWVKVFLQEEESGSAREVQVDQFLVADGFDIAAESAQSFSYQWTVPGHAAGGQYYAAHFVTIADTYNQTGLIQTDVVTGDVVDFKVISQNGPLLLQRALTQVDGATLTEDGEPVIVASISSARVEAAIYNDTDETKNLVVQWNQYPGDFLSSLNEPYTNTSVVTVEPGAIQVISYSLRDLRTTQAIVTVMIEDNDARSYQTVRLQEEGSVELSVPYSGVSKFPLTEGDAVTLFTCAQATNGLEVDDITVEMRLTDQSGSLIEDYTHNGTVSGADNNAYGVTFIPSSNFEQVTLSTVVQKGDTVVAETTLVYNCEELGVCSGGLTDGGKFYDVLLQPGFYFFAGVIVLLLLLALVWSVHRRHEGPNINTMNTTKTLLFLLAIAGLSAIPTEVVEANPCTTPKVEMTIGTSPSCNDLGYDLIHPNQDLSTWRAVAPNTECVETVDFNGSEFMVNRYEASSCAGPLPLPGPGPSSCPAVSLQGTWRNTGTSNYPAMFAWNSCPTGYVKSGAVDDSDSVRRLTEASRSGSGQHLCVRASNPEFTITSTWASSCPAGTTNVTVTDDTNDNGYSNRHYTWEEDSNGITSGLRWCMGVNSSNPLYQNQYEIQAVRRAGFSCQAGEYKLIETRYNGNNFHWDMNTENDNGSWYSLCASIQEVPGANCTPPNSPPDDPVLGGPTTGQTNQNLSFTARSSDPEGDSVRIGISNNSTCSSPQWLPGSGYAASNVTHNFSRNWSTAGTKTIYAVAEDENGGRSSCVSLGVNISTPPPVSADLQINSSNGPLTVNKGQTLNLSWTSSNAANCSLWGAGLPGGSVALTGNTSTLAPTTTGASETYTLNCDGAVDTVTINVQNRAPDAPTVTKTSGNNEEGSPQTFSFRGIDPDGDNIFYEIDWNNDGTPDDAQPTTGSVPSNDLRTDTYTWPSAGSFVIRARTADLDGARSGWTTLNVTINAAPPPTANLQIQHNGGAWVDGPLTIGAQDSLGIRWSSTNASSCTGTNFNTGGAANRMAGINLTVPSAGSVVTYSIACDGVSNLDSITVTVEHADLSIAGWTLDVDNNSFNPGTMSYGSGEVLFTHSNVTSLSAVPNTTATLAYTGNPTATAPGLAGGTEYIGQVSIPISNVALGSFSATLTLNDPQSVTEKTRANNSATIAGSVPAPDPGLFITADRFQVRTGDSVELSWGASLVYAMDCTVEGPGVNINPAVLGTAASPQSATTPAPPGITAKSEYILTCTETTTNTTFTDSVEVETVGSVEEI